jgi:DNA-binding beta-propeller fold protein YncE
VAFTADGAKAFVAGQRGNVAFNKTFVSPFNGSELRGTITVIDAATHAVLATLDNAGIEPYGLAVAPNGKYFAVTGFRSGTVKCFDVATLARWRASSTSPTST